MTYLEFHLVFILPPLLLLLLWTRPRPPRLWAYLLMPLIALLYTTPWDNFLVYRGSGATPRTGSSSASATCPWRSTFFSSSSLSSPGPSSSGWRGLRPRGGPGLFRVVGGGFWLLVAALGVMLLALGGEYLYLGLILAYFAPVFLLQWAFGGDLLVAWRKPFLLGTALPTLYLWFADFYAITREGIWWISKEYTLGLSLAGLPLEEMLFFLFTNLAVVQGLLLAWHPEALRRLK